MATTPVQVRMPREMLKEIDRWVGEGRFANRSEAVKTIVALYDEREHTRAFYEMLSTRSREARRNPEDLVPLDELA